MPALVNRSVGSPAGTSEELATRRWFFDSKYARNCSRIWLVVSNRGLLDDAAHERGVVTLIQQIHRQSLSPIGRVEVGGTVAAHEQAPALVARGRQIFAFAILIGVFANGLP